MRILWAAICVVGFLMMGVSVNAKPAAAATALRNASECNKDNLGAVRERRAENIQIDECPGNNNNWPGQACLNGAIVPTNDFLYSGSEVRGLEECSQQPSGGYYWRVVCMVARSRTDRCEAESRKCMVKDCEGKESPQGYNYPVVKNAGWEPWVIDTIFSDPTRCQYMLAQPTVDVPAEKARASRLNLAREGSKKGYDGALYSKIMDNSKLTSAERTKFLEAVAKVPAKMLARAGASCSPSPSPSTSTTPRPSARPPVVE